MSNKKDKRFLVGLTLLLLIPCIGLIGLGRSQPKNVRNLDLCNLKNGEIGIIKGIVLSVSRSNNRKMVSITEGTQGCQVVISQRAQQIGEMKPGNRIQVKAKVINKSMVEGLGKPSLAYDVVDAEGNIGELEEVILSVRKKESSFIQYRTRDGKNGIPYTKTLKFNESINSQIRIGREYKIKFSKDTKEIVSVEDLGQIK